MTGASVASRRSSNESNIPVSLGRESVIYALGALEPPVLTIDPGQLVAIETELNLGDVIHNLTDTFRADLVPDRVNPATGPIAIRGATSAHAVTCRIVGIELDSVGVTGLVPGHSAFVDWLNGREFGVHGHVVEIRNGTVRWPIGDVQIPISPMVGVLGCAPEFESISTRDNGPHGGNLDVQEVRPGCTVILPVAVDGALFALGDCHAIQGDGELCGIGGIECRTTTTVELDLMARPTGMTWPRLDNGTHIGVIACARPLEDAFRLAVWDLVRWLDGEYGIPIPEAVMLLGQVAEARATQIVNPKFTYVVKIAKRYLPDRTAR